MHKTMMTALCGGEYRYKVLCALAASRESLGLMDLATRTGLEPGNITRTLKPLVEAGLVDKVGRDRAWSYGLRDDPNLKPLLQLLDPSAYLARRLTELFEYDPDIEFAAIFGSIARGDEKPGSDVDLLVLGDASPVYLNANLMPLGNEIGRPINAAVHTKAEFEQLQVEGNSFATSVLQGKLIILKGQLHGSPPFVTSSGQHAQHCDQG